MKIYTSYFYQIRFFKPWMIPLSTALSDPKWYHNSKGKNYVFTDSNHVVNGLRFPALSPGKGCANLCTGKSCKLNPESCIFLKRYRDQLDSINFNKFVSWVNKFPNEYYENLRKLDLFGEFPEHDAIAVFIVHEAPANPCSERVALHQWIKDNGHIPVELDPKHFKL